MDIAAGLHTLLKNQPRLVEAAGRTGQRLFDVRLPQVQYPIGDGKKRTGKRILAVGTDCSCGKMYTACAMEKEMRDRGMKATFRATGQTGILVTGEGVPLDAVVADFMAGAVETLTPNNDEDHWDLIEGQGSLFHPSYSGVTMALIHGGQPDYLVLCHEPTREHMRGLPHYVSPGLAALRTLLADFADFDGDNDPWGEHDFGAFDFAGRRLFWKIDYYGPDLVHGADDPGDLADTFRVMTIMLASEY